jgi:hypothetical protein
MDTGRARWSAAVAAASKTTALWPQYSRLRQRIPFHYTRPQEYDARLKEVYGWQKTPLMNSLLVPPPGVDAADYVHGAIKLHKKLLAVCGDKGSRNSVADNMAALHRLAAEKMDHTGAPLRLGEEFVFQLFKHMNGNPKVESDAVCWRLLCYALASVPLPDTPDGPYLPVLSFLLAEKARAEQGAFGSRWAAHQLSG